jgi:hypothetical protein
MRRVAGMVHVYIIFSLVSVTLEAFGGCLYKILGYPRRSALAL